MKKQTFVAILLIGLIGAMFAFKQNLKRRSSVISVYVHGTLFSWRNLLASIPGAAELTYVPDGLTSVSDLDQNAVAHCLAIDFCKRDSRRFIYDNFYAFGWSGKLSFEERAKSAQFLTQELLKLVDEHEQNYGIKPILRIVTFSHGGNVALNMAQFLPKDLQVELVLIACPVQPETEDCVLADCFTKVYVISSLNDIAQVADPLNIFRNFTRGDAKKQVLSKRFFDHNIDKLKQACVSVNGTYLGHLELFQLFNKHIPAVLNRLDALPEIKGTTKLYFDVEDKYFPFLNGINVIDVLKGKIKEPGQESVDE